MSNSQSAQSSSVSLSCVVMNRKEIDVSLQVHFHRAIYNQVVHLLNLYPRAVGL